MTDTRKPIEISDDQLETATGGPQRMQQSVLTNNETVTKARTKALDDGQPLVEVARKW